MFREKQMAESKTIGSAYLQDINGPDSLSKLNRYEISIERSLFRTINELQRLQAVRKGLLTNYFLPPFKVSVRISRSKFIKSASPKRIVEIIRSLVKPTKKVDHPLQIFTAV